MEHEKNDLFISKHLKIFKNEWAKSPLHHKISLIELNFEKEKQQTYSQPPKTKCLKKKIKFENTFSQIIHIISLYPLNYEKKYFSFTLAHTGGPSEALRFRKARYGLC